MKLMATGRSFVSGNTPDRCRADREWMRIFDRRYEYHNPLPAHYQQIKLEKKYEPATKSQG